VDVSGEPAEGRTGVAVDDERLDLLCRGMTQSDQGLFGGLDRLLALTSRCSMLLLDFIVRHGRTGVARGVISEGGIDGIRHRNQLDAIGGRHERDPRSCGLDREIRPVSTDNYNDHGPKAKTATSLDAGHVTERL
jgi:hypothetical protein